MDECSASAQAPPLKRGITNKKPSKGGFLCYNITMINKHFFKTLIIFAIMIALGLLAVYLAK